MKKEMIRHDIYGKFKNVITAISIPKLEFPLFELVSLRVIHHLNQFSKPGFANQIVNNMVLLCFSWGWLVSHNHFKRELKVVYMEWKIGERGVVKHGLKQRGVVHEWREKMNVMLAENAPLLWVFCWLLIYCVWTSTRCARSSTFHDRSIFISSSSINSLESFIFAGIH